MIFPQLFVWALIATISGITAYLFLTEGKNKLLLVIVLLFNLSSGIFASYIYIQMTNGLAMYSSAIIFLPALIASISTVFMLAYFKTKHPKSSFPKHPEIKIGKLPATIALIVIIFASMFVAISSVPVTTTTPTIAAIGSTGWTILNADEVINVSRATDPAKSSGIMIQSSAISPTDLSDNPVQGKYLSFKVELAPSPEYLQPLLKIIVQDANKKLIPASDIQTFPQTGNSIEGRIYCNKSGEFTIIAAVYDLAFSETDPIATNFLSYTVASVTPGVEARVNYFSAALVLVFAIVVILILLIALYKKYM